jgi:hypothetical protein
MVIVFCSLKPVSRFLDKDAFVWMMRAAKAGHSSAQNNIGLSYLHGLGVIKDKNKAFEWFVGLNSPNIGKFGNVGINGNGKPA